MRKLICVAVCLAALAACSSGGDRPEPSGSDPTAGSAEPASPSPSASVKQGQATDKPAASSRTRWEGPDEAVESFPSDACRAMVIAFGPQLYLPGDEVAEIPAEARYLGYHSGSLQLWGDRGAPSILYVTADGGRNFKEYRATDRQC